MIRYLLDTNILSEVVKPSPSQPVLDWFAAQDDASLFLSSLTLAEIRRGILDMAPGRRRIALEGWFSGADGPMQLFAGRILPFDAPAALCWAQLMADGRAEKRSRSPLDTIIAATAQANGCVVVTANLRHFPSVDAINPRDVGELAALTPPAPP